MESTLDELKLKCFAKIAQNVSMLSTCKRLNVGCVIATNSLTDLISIGYNVPGQIGSRCSAKEGACGCAHAEYRALNSQRVRDAWRLVLICTTSPCESCAQAIIRSGRIHTVCYITEYRIISPIEMLKRANINVYQIRL